MLFFLIFSIQHLISLFSFSNSLILTSPACTSPSLRSEDRSMVLITHYQRLLDYIVPDRIHVLAGGRIVRSGGKELALELEEKGYGWLEEGGAEA